MDPQWYRWNGAALIPQRPELAELEFRIGGIYLLEAHHDRSYARHRAFFASLNEAWQSLDHDDWPSVEFLRKVALIRTGWRDERTLVCGSHAEAERIATWCQPLDSFAVFWAEGELLHVWTAKSQSYRAMGRDDFNRSMDDVLGYVAHLIGVARDELEAQGGAA